MKSLLLLLFLACSLKAADVQLTWDASPSEGVTDYVIYAHTNALSSTNLIKAVVKQAVGTNLTAKVEGITGTWWFTVTAKNIDGLESDHSNVVTGTWTPPVKAMAPGNMRFDGLSAGPWKAQFLTKYFRMRW